MENSRKQTNIFGYCIFCNCRKCKQSMGVINYFSVISKLLSCIHITTYTHIGNSMEYHDQECFFPAQVHDIAYQLCILHIHCHVLKHKCACHCIYICTYGAHQGIDMMLVKEDYVPFKGVVTYEKVLSSLITCTVFPIK